MPKYGALSFSRNGKPCFTLLFKSAEELLAFNTYQFELIQHLRENAGATLPEYVGSADPCLRRMIRRYLGYCQAGKK